MLFKHYKGKYYWTYGSAISANNGDQPEAVIDPQIVYTPLYPCKIHLFTRKYSEFHSEVKNPEGFGSIKRFKRVGCGSLSAALSAGLITKEQAEHFQHFITKHIKIPTH